MAEVRKIAGMTVSKHEPLGTPGFGKKSAHLGTAGNIRIIVQLVSPNGGETNLHAHPASDSVWTVLTGKAKFYGMNDALVGEIGPGEWVFIPKGVPYWFENGGDDPVEICRIASRDPTVNVTETRVNYSPFTENQQKAGKSNGRPATEEEKKAAAVL